MQRVCMPRRREGGIYRPCVYSVVCRRRIYRYRQGGRGGGGPLSVPHPVSVFFPFSEIGPILASGTGRRRRRRRRRRRECNGPDMGSLLRPTQQPSAESLTSLLLGEMGFALLVRRREFDHHLHRPHRPVPSVGRLVIRGRSRNSPRVSLTIQFISFPPSFSPPHPARPLPISFQASDFPSSTDGGKKGMTMTFCFPAAHLIIKMLGAGRGRVTPPFPFLSHFSFLALF